jgi:hypothetical protein
MARMEPSASAHRLSALSALACAALLVVGCKRGGSEPGAVAGEAPVDEVAATADHAPERERIVLSSIAIQTVDPDPAREIYPELLAQALGRQLSESAWYVPHTEPVPDGFFGRRGRVELLISYDVVGGGRGEGKATAAVVTAIEAELVWEDEAAGGLALRDNVLLERPLSPADRANLDGLVATQVADAVGAVGRALIEKARIRAGTAAEVIAALAGTDPELALWALDVVAARQLHEAFDAAVALLGSEARPLRDGAVSALVALGDRRAVDPLANSAEFGDHEQMRVVIEAISALGGEDAREYLEFVASGHPEEDLRQRAAEGLERLFERPNRRGAASADTTGPSPRSRRQ